MFADPFALALACGAALLAGVSRGLTGFGGALILAPVLVYIIEPAIMIAVIMLTDLPANAWLIRGVWREWDRPFVGTIVAGTLVGVPAGVLVLSMVAQSTVARAVFALVALAALLLISGWRYRRELGRWELVMAGGFNGLVLGSTSIGTGMVPVMYGGTATMRKARANMIVWMTITSPVLFAMVLLVHGGGRALVEWAMVLAPLYTLGVFVGERFSRRIDETLFRRIVLVALLAAGLVGLFS